MLTEGAEILVNTHDVEKVECYMANLRISTNLF